MTKQHLVLALFSALAPLALAACSAPAGDPGTSSHAALSDGEGDGTDDEDLAYFKEHGFGSIRNTAACVSKTEGGPDVTGDTLPVGAGRWLECVTASKVSAATMSVMSSASVPWCVLGAVATSSGAGDSRLVVTIIDAPEGGPWTVKAVHEGGDSIDITPIAGPFGSTMWPVWVSATYATTAMQPAVDGATCDESFGQSAGE